MDYTREEDAIAKLKGACSCDLRCQLGDCQSITSRSADGPVTSKLPWRISDDVMVFISHVGEQKKAVAHPLQEALD